MESRKEKGMLLISMAIFGTIGLLRRHIPCSSGFVALVRGLIGAVFLLTVVLLQKEKPDLTAIRKNGLLLVLSGAALGFNWIFLFEAYNYTSVATATLCYYLAPILVVLVSPLVLKERLTPRKFFCALVALFGMVLVSGVAESGFGGSGQWAGIGFGLAAASLYATVMLLNKKISNISTYDKTIAQLFLAALVMAPYVLLTDHPGQMSLSASAVILLLIAGIVHTGIAYWLYFGAMGSLKAQTVALYSYLDPILAIVLSMVVLNEPMTPAAGVGAVMILGAAFSSER